MKTNTQKSFSFLALGDSYTIGEGVSETDQFPVQLKNRLQQAGYNVNNSQIIAKTGWTTDELLEGIDKVSLSPHYNLITLLIGVNNQYRGRDLENYREELILLINKAILFADGDKSRVIIISIPDWGVTPFAKNRDKEKIALEIDAFNHVNYQESMNFGVKYVDVTAISREAQTKPELIAVDELHPSGLMYKYWVDKLFPIALEIIKNQ